MTCLIVEFAHLAQCSPPDLLSSAGISQVPLPTALPLPIGAANQVHSSLTVTDAPLDSIGSRKRSSLCAAGVEDRNGPSGGHPPRIEDSTAEKIDSGVSSKRVRLDDAHEDAAAHPATPAVNETC